jgi:hypothetical protein
MFRGAMILFVLAVLACAGTVIAQRAADEPASKEDPIKALARARLALAREGLQAIEKQAAAGTNPYPQATWVWADRVLRAELELSTKPEERITALKAYVQRARSLEQTIRAGLKEKIFTLPEILDAQYNRLGAEMQLAQEEDRQKNRPR